MEGRGIIGRMDFTEEQKKVIAIEGADVLVSAAAGSGKTAVIVERVIRKTVRDGGDLMRLLIVTFTRAAASEMRERIRDALEEEYRSAETEEMRERISRQLSMIFTAPITTIDGFCLDLIRSNFNLCGIDPAFRVADEGELSMLKGDVMESLMERHYEEDGEDSPFYAFLERFSLRRNDEDVVWAIMKLHEFAGSRPDPEAYLKGIAGQYGAEDEEELLASDFMREGVSLAEARLCSARQAYETAEAICLKPEGPEVYLDLIRREKESVERLLALDSWQDLKSALCGISFDRLPVKRNDPADKALKEQAKDLRNSAKKIINEVAKQYFGMEPEDILKELSACRPMAEELSALALEFAAEYTQAKRKRGIVDFTDLEHYALEILKDEGARERTERSFDEIIVDEYQDSNRIQEEIFSRISNGRNYFCVGDIKQSIYSFRDACPKLFAGKYDRFRPYGEEGAEGGVRITLAKNFRSRKEVIGSVNGLFQEIMHRDTGGVEYDKDARLYYGELFRNENEDAVTECLTVLTDPQNTLDPREAEAQAVCQRIQSLVGSFPVEDKKTGVRHPCRYGDIVILLRTRAGWDDVFMETLTENGIPARMESRDGYLLSFEIRTMLNFLSVIDNPRQDIPLAGTLLSIFGDFTEEETAVIRSRLQTGGLYDALVFAAGEGEDPLAVKAGEFLKKLSHYRNRSAYLSVRELIDQIIRDFRFDLYVRSMPGGAMRLSNLRMLLTRADQFEKTSFRGLFRFIRYIEAMRKYEVDFGGANPDNDEDAVVIMSIHHSKGMEFPVVFLSGMGKKFNLADTRERLLLDDELGAGMDRTDPKRRTRKRTLIKMVIAGRRKREVVAEEMRILYVAMTRAREKLILTTSRDASKAPQIPASASEASCFADWLSFGFAAGEGISGSILKEEWPEEELAVSRVLEEDERKHQKEDFLEEAGKVPEEEIHKLKERTAYAYPHEDSLTVPDKVSVSVLKHEAMEEAGIPLIRAVEERKSTVPRFISGLKRKPGGPVKGALRGTAYHTAFEHFPFGEIRTKKDVKDFTARLVREHKLTGEEAGMIRAEDLLTFAGGELASRMERAERQGKLYREQPFVILVPAKEVNPAYPEGETVMVQGIIDAFFEEDGRLVVVDYKTDRAAEASELVERYRAQLKYYGRALKQLTGKEASELLLYAVSFGTEVPV